MRSLFLVQGIQAPLKFVKYNDVRGTLSSFIIHCYNLAAGRPGILHDNEQQPFVQI